MQLVLPIRPNALRQFLSRNAAHGPILAELHLPLMAILVLLVPVPVVFMRSISIVPELPPLEAGAKRSFNSTLLPPVRLMGICGISSSVNEEPCTDMCVIRKASVPRLRE